MVFKITTYLIAVPIIAGVAALICSHIDAAADSDPVAAIGILVTCVIAAVVAAALWFKVFNLDK